jgi:Tol biopolymer transport system component
VGVLEQNVLGEDGRGTNTYAGRTLLAAWAGFSVIGFLHAKANTGAVASGRGLLTIGVCGAMGEGVPPSPGGICTMRPDGSELHQITTQPRDDEPSWSPDRKQVAFVRTDSRGSHLDIVNADGSGIQALTLGRADHAPAWSPRGDKIAFARSGRITVVDVASGDVTPLTAGPLDGDPSWSANGALIAFDRGAGDVQIDVMTSGGRNRHALATGGQPAWAPTGTMLAYTRFTQFGSHIAVIDGLSGKAGHDLTAGQADDSYTPVWSPDAQQIAFGRGVNMENPGVWVMDADGTNQLRLAGGYHPSW